jgi:hypothetical protein
MESPAHNKAAHRSPRASLRKRKLRAACTDTGMRKRRQLLMSCTNLDSLNLVTKNLNNIAGQTRGRDGGGGAFPSGGSAPFPKAAARYHGVAAASLVRPRWWKGSLRSMVVPPATAPWDLGPAWVFRAWAGLWI